MSKQQKRELDKVYAILENNQEGTVEFRGEEWNSMVLVLMAVIGKKPELVTEVLKELIDCDYEPAD